MALSKVKELTGLLAVEIVRGQVTGGTTATYVSRFGTIVAVLASDETSAGVVKASWSGSTVTVTATQNDYVGVLIVGY